MKIDISTLALLLGLNTLLQLITLFAQYRVDKTYNGPGWWTVGSAVIFLGSGFNYFIDNSVVGNVAIVVSNACFITGIALLYVGVLRFFGQRERRGWLIGFCVGFTLIMIYFTYVDPNIALRRLSMSVAIALLSFIIAWSFFIYKTRSVAAFAPFLIGLFLSSGAFYTIRAYVTVIDGGGINDILASSPIQIATYFFLLSSNMLWTFGLIIMLNQRLHFENRATEEALRASELNYRSLTEQYRGLMESLDSVIATLDYDGRFLYMNRIATEQLGGNATELIGKTMYELFPKQVAARQLQNMQQVLREDKGAVFEALSLINNQLRWHRTSIQPVHDATGRVAYALVNSTDIHDLKTAQQQLLELNRTLEERVRARTADLSRVNAELEHAVHAKDEFLANMSHELRTPLNAILALSETLLEQVRGPLNDRQQSSLRSIESSGRHLLSLISDILDLAKIEAGKVELQHETVAITEVCQASLLFVKEIAFKKQLQLAFQLNNHSAQFVADPKRVKQMLVNLLSNAVKFTAKGGKVSLEVETDSSAEMVRFSVQDTGIGIAPPDLERLFQPFTQLDSSLSRHHEGTGLGLALTHRLVELHGGSIVVESQVDKGSRFTIMLPYKQKKPPKDEEPTTDRSEPAKLVAPVPQALSLAPPPAVAPVTRVLLVEDNDFNIEAIGDYLQDRSYYVVVARNGLEAIEQAKEFQPAIILMDIQMPYMDGLEATRHLRTDPHFVSTPIIALTALAMPGDRERCLTAGANEYLTKPVVLKGLVETIERLLQGDTMRR